jgi:hypothetical protein
MGGISVRFRAALLLCTFFLGGFTVAAWSTTSQPEYSTAPAENQSVAGKISSVGDAEFTLEVHKSQNPDSNSNTLQFLVDANTKVEGKLTVGAQATVEYRDAEGKYIATRVVVTPASGMTRY